MKKKTVRYDSSIITYIDILGFRRLIDEKTPGEISRILRVVKETVAPDKSLSKLVAFRVQHFSDLAVRVLPITPQRAQIGDLFLELLSIVHMQKELIEQGIFIRGGITFGYIVKSWGLLYGPGLIKAYDLEQTASYPRVLVDPDLLSVELRRNPLLRRHDYKTESEYIDKLIRKDFDNQYFIDYLRAIESEFDYPEVGYLRFLEMHRSYIVTGLDKFRLEKKILKKYAWLKQYHNSTISQRFDKGFARKYVI